MIGASAAAATQPGAVLGGFRLVEQLGADGLGELFRGQNVHAPKLLRALRVLRPDLVVRPDFRAQLLRVIELLDTFEHPNLLGIHHLGEEQEVLFTVQDLLVGRTLRMITQEQRTRQPVSVVVDWIYQALCGLAHAHHHGVIHQDLKPESLFLTQSGVVKVTDFELVRLGEFITAKHPPGRAEGLNAPSYFAPEFAEGTSPSAVSDVYAMGLCMHEFLAGEPPYRAGSGTSAQAAIAILLQHLTKPLPDLRQTRQDVPEGLLAILNKATAKQPSARYQSADEFGAALMPYLGHAELPLGAKSDDQGTPVAPELLSLHRDYPVKDHPESSVIELGWSEEGHEEEQAPEPKRADKDREDRHQRDTQSDIPKDRNRDGKKDSPQDGKQDLLTEMPDPETWSPLEVTAPQPSVEDLPRVESDSVHASAKEPFFVKLRYLLLGVFVTLLLVGGTAVGTAYFLRVTLRLDRLPAEPPGGRSAVLNSAATTPPPTPTPNSAASAPGGPSQPSNMILIPAGTFRMGSRDGYPDERPEHVESVNVFWMDKHEVTVRDYEKCVLAGECRKQKSIRQSDADHKFDRFCNYGRKSRDEHPMNCVDWYQARAYCRWIGKRLPTEPEWEYAARGSDGRKFPWGSQAPSEGQLNACGRECVILGSQVGKKWNSMYAADDGWDATAPVGSFANDKSPFGVLDMAGNVSEWTDTEYAKCYRDDCEPDGKERVIRGGAWNDDDRSDVRAAYRNRDAPLLRGSFVGFRCAKTDVPSSPATH